jgi:mRNA-degrading endonuclease toxin of MazEF toxin-antitoxin module
MPYSQRDIVMADFQLPSGRTPHPFLIISTENVWDFDDCYVAVMITSALHNDNFSFPLDDSTLLKPLLKKSEVRCHLISVLESKWITKKVTSLKSEPFHQVIDKILQEVICIID